MESILYLILTGVFSARAVATDVPVLLLNQPNLWTTGTTGVLHNPAGLFVHLCVSTCDGK